MYSGVIRMVIALKDCCWDIKNEIKQTKHCIALASNGHLLCSPGCGFMKGTL